MISSCLSYIRAVKVLRTHTYTGNFIFLLGKHCSETEMATIFSKAVKGYLLLWADFWFFFSKTCLIRPACCLSALLTSFRYSATFPSRDVCSIFICSVTFRIFCHWYFIDYGLTIRELLDLSSLTLLSLHTAWYLENARILSPQTCREEGASTSLSALPWSRLVILRWYFPVGLPAER